MILTSNKLYISKYIGLKILCDRRTDFPVGDHLGERCFVHAGIIIVMIYKILFEIDTFYYMYIRTCIL